MQIQTWTYHIHTHPCPIVYHVCTRNTHGTTPYSPSSITFTFLPPPSHVLPFFRFSVSFFSSFYPAFPSVSRGWTCCRSDMQQHARVTAMSVPVHPFILSHSFCIHPSIHHPFTLLVNSINLAGAVAMRVGGTPPPTIIRQASKHQRRPFSICVCVARETICMHLCFWSIVSRFGLRMSRFKCNVCIVLPFHA